MIIHGQTFKEIFDKLPLPYKAVVVFGSVFLFIVFIFLSSKIAKITMGFSSAPKIEISGSAKNITGFMNPSIASGDIFSVIAVSAQTGGIRNIRLLKNVANRNCNKWHYIKDVGIEGKADTLIATDGLNDLYNGMWSIETPSIVYTPDDKGKEWKLFAYKYFWPNGEDLNTSIETAKKYSVITYKYSSDPLQNWSNEEWLFSPNEDHPPTPYKGLVKNHLNKLSFELSDITSYARPSVIYQDGILLMALSAFTTSTTPDRTILIASSDQGKNWIYIGSAFSKKDTKYFDDALYKGATLIKHKKGIYLAATFGDQRSDNQTAIIKFRDAGTAELYREDDGEPIVTNSFELFGDEDEVTSSGFPTYSSVCKKLGLIVSEKQKQSGNYKLFSTGIDPAD